MTMTHSNEVSKNCQPCPTDSNGRVVIPEKKNLMRLLKAADLQVVRDTTFLNDRIAFHTVGRGNATVLCCIEQACAVLKS